MLHDALFALWFLLPAGFANMAPIFAAAVPFLKKWDTPMDGGRRFQGEPLLGPHKTWRGIASGVFAATVTLWSQQVLVAHSGWLQTITTGVDYAGLPTLLLGPLFGIGALGADALESFLKRRRGIKPGDVWLFFDQLDYVMGAVLVSLPFVVLPLGQYAWIFGIWFLLHLSTSYLGWVAGFKKHPI